MTDVEIAWAAGFFDGEGCTTLARKGGNAHVRIVVMQKDPEVLHRFHAAVGVGAIYYHDRKSACPMWAWQTTNEADSRAVIELLRPYLGTVKREQADRCIEASTWHDGARDQLRCKDPTHEVVERKSGGRRCRTCQQRYMRNWKATRDELTAASTPWNQR